MKRQNLHCHTIYDDGQDSPEMMVFTAIGAGLSGLGISLHCPISGGDGWSCLEENEPKFIEEMHRLRDFYGERMHIWCGLEYDLDAERRSVPPYDYIIGSCHNLGGLALDYDPEEAMQLIACHGGDVRAAQLYYARLSAMADMREISIVGHFDLPTKFNEKAALYDTASPLYRDAAFAAMEKLNAAGKIFEINAGAVASGWRSAPYPSEELLRHLHEIGGRVCISSDAHSAKNLLFGFEMCEELARACGFREVWHFSGGGFEPEKLA